MSQKIQGIFTPHMVPLDEQGRINEPELRRYIDWLIDRGVHGLYPNGSTGEFVRFTAEERRRIVKIVCEQAAGIFVARLERRKNSKRASAEQQGNLISLSMRAGKHALNNENRRAMLRMKSV